MARERAVRKSQAPGVKRRERRGDTRPQEIVDAAFEEFAVKGYAGTRLEDVAARAHLLAHFDVMRQRMETTTLSSEAFLKGPFLSFLQELVCSKRAFIARLMIAEGHKHPELTKFYYDQVVSRGIETLTRLIERGEFRQTRLREFPQLLVAPALTAILWRALFERHHHLDTDGLLATNIELLTDAIRAPGPVESGKGEER